MTYADSQMNTTSDFYVHLIYFGAKGAQKRELNRSAQSGSTRFFHCVAGTVNENCKHVNW